MLNQLFLRVLEEYPDCRVNQPLKAHPLAQIIRNDIPNAFLDSGIIGVEYKVKGSAGQGRWAIVPWIGIRNTHIANSVNSGILISYLFAPDGSTLYPTLLLGVGENQGKADYLKAGLEFQASKVRHQLQCPDSFHANNRLDLGDSLYQAGIIFWKEYSKDMMPTDGTIIHDLQLLLNVYGDAAKHTMGLG